MGFAATKVIAQASEIYHVIIASRTLQKAETAKIELESLGVNAEQLSTVKLEVTDEQSIEQAAAFVQDKFGRLDVLINNAAVGSRGDKVKTRFQESMDVNVVGPAVTADHFRPLLLKSKNPYSIYVSSGQGSFGQLAGKPEVYNRGPPKGEAYRVSKAALNMIAVCESMEYGPLGLKVFAMCPGLVRSKLRGPSEEEQSAWGHAGDATVSGETLLSIVQGKRDADVGKLVYKNGGVYPW